MESLFNLEDYGADGEVQAQALASEMENKVVSAEEPEVEEQKPNEIIITSTIHKEEISIKSQDEQIFAQLDTIDPSEYNNISSPALLFPFELDVFQKRSIIRLEKKENVLVCAHTSSGKTVVAEYAIALSKKKEKQVFYTSPIKALSNQKYREFTKKFSDVGIMTGDVSIRPDAQCLIMTTEILQSMLYKSSERLDRVEWIVFDEVHYINDNERGHVWEEILILLPPSIGIVMLSATIPNFAEFAQWVGRIKNSTIYIQLTKRRIVPLEHSIFINPKKIYTVKYSNDKVNQENIYKAISDITEVNTKTNAKIKSDLKTQKERQQKEAKLLQQIRAYHTNIGQKAMKEYNHGGGSVKSNKPANTITLTHLKLEEIVQYLAKENLTPAVVFVFSIKKLDEYAQMVSGNCLQDKSNSHRILTFFDQCMKTLSEEDRAIPQIQMIRQMIPSGIGVHHAGLLPILKEVIEILYSQGLLKVLFATTSFSIGLNMPTRTVVFSDITKFAEGQKELLSSSEYLQMCGRAGRRGIDDIGRIFLLMGDKISPPLPDDVYHMLLGEGTEVESRFRLQYRTILSFLSRNIKDIIQFFRESYLENANLMLHPQLCKEIAQLKEEINSSEKILCKFPGLEEPPIGEYLAHLSCLKQARKKLYTIPSINSKLNKAGRAILYNSKKERKDLIVIILLYDGDNELWCLTAKNPEKTEIEYEETNSSTYAQSGIINGQEFIYFSIGLDEVVDILDYTLKLDPKKQFDFDQDGYPFIKKKELDNIIKDLIELNKQIDQYQLLDYMKVNSNEIEAHDPLKKKNANHEIIKSSPCHDCYLRGDHLKQYQSLQDLERKYDNKQGKLKEDNLSYFNEFQKRIKILQHLEYLDENNQLLIKGKASKEITTSDCVFITEILINNIFQDLDLDEMVALISGFAFNKNELSFEDPYISENFSQAIWKCQEIYNSLYEVEAKCEFEESKYNRRITFGVSKPILLWMQGKSFAEVLEETDHEEGKMFSLIMRLAQFFDEIKNFYVILGNDKLSSKFEEAKTLLLRGIFTSKSLYLQEDIDIDNL